MWIGRLACIVSISALSTGCAVSVAARPPVHHHRHASGLEVEGALDAHGQWVTVASYGRVWRPLGVPAGWRPYTYGTWTWIDDAWTWRSDFDWGWAAFHYGRWYEDPAYGWVWVPGDVWGPAWVSWHVLGGHIGWAPLGPPGWRAPAYGWCFVRRSDFGRRHVRRVLVRPAERDRLVRARPARRRPIAPARGRVEARPARSGRSAGSAWVGTSGGWEAASAPARPASTAVRGRAEPAREAAPKVRRGPSAQREVTRGRPARVKRKATYKKAPRVKARPAPKRKAARKAPKRRRD